MINKILKDIDNEESYYVGTNGCLYQDLGKEELLAIKQEIERLHSIIKEVREYIENNKQWYDKELGLVEIEGYKSNRIPIVYLYGLLEILDKVEEK